VQGVSGMNKRQEKRGKGGRQERIEKTLNWIYISDREVKGLKEITVVGLSQGKKEKSRGKGREREREREREARN
jgi:hypothetical protein